jgi:hypothetical protein
MARVGLDSCLSICIETRDTRGLPANELAENIKGRPVEAGLPCVALMDLATQRRHLLDDFAIEDVAVLLRS